MWREGGRDKPPVHVMGPIDSYSGSKPESQPHKHLIFCVRFLGCFSDVTSETKEFNSHRPEAESER